MRLRFDQNFLTPIYFAYQKTLKPVLEYKIVFWNHKGYPVVKNWCEMFVYKLESIQKKLKFLLIKNRFNNNIMYTNVVKHT